MPIAKQKGEPQIWSMVFFVHLWNHQTLSDNISNYTDGLSYLGYNVGKVPLYFYKRYLGADPCQEMNVC